MGPSIKYVTLFWPILTPPPPVTLCHTSPDPPENTSPISGPPPIFSRPSTKTRTKALVQILSQLFARAFVRGLLSGGLLSGSFCPGWFVSVPPSVRIHLLQQKVKHHLKFHV